MFLLAFEENDTYRYPNVEAISESSYINGKGLA